MLLVIVFHVKIAQNILETLDRFNIYILNKNAETVDFTRLTRLT